MVLVETAKLVLEVRGSGRLAVVQRVGGGGGITLDSVLVQEEQSEVEMEVMDEFFLFLFSIETFPVAGATCSPRLDPGCKVEPGLGGAGRPGSGESHSPNQQQGEAH